MALLVLGYHQCPGSPLGLVLATRATSWLVGMHPPPGSEWMVGVPAAVLCCGCLSVRQSTMLLSPMRKVTSDCVT